MPSVKHPRIFVAGGARLLGPRERLIESGAQVRERGAEVI